MVLKNTSFIIIIPSKKKKNNKNLISKSLFHNSLVLITKRTGNWNFHSNLLI